MACHLPADIHRFMQSIWKQCLWALQHAVVLQLAWYDVQAFALTWVVAQHMGFCDTFASTAARQQLYPYV